MSGSGASGGLGFQHRAAAWLAVRALAETNAALPWALPAAVTLDLLRCEQNQPIDDILAGTSAGGFIYCQSKRSLSVSAQQDTEFDSVFDQFVRQFIACRDRVSAGRSWARPVDPARDRFVLIVGPTATAPVRIHLAAVLERMRGLAQGQPLADSAVNEEERRVLDAVLGCTRRAWQTATGTAPTDAEIRQVLSPAWVTVLDLDDGGAAELEAKTLLRTGVLAQPADADAAWTSLVSLCQDLATIKSGRDRRQLQRRLTDATIGVLAARSYRDDLARLKAYSATTVQLLADLSRVRVGAAEVKIRRPALDELRRLSLQDSILVCGEPGAGKSGALHGLADGLIQGGGDVVFLAVDRLAAESMGNLRQELNLTRDLADVLANWPGTDPGFLVVDALDAARGSAAARTLLDLIALVRQIGGRWRVVASIRKFDLRYSDGFRALFAGMPSPAFSDPEFAAIRHVNIPVLSDEEIAQIAGQAPALGDLIARAPDDLRQLLRIPFNLRLAADLLTAGVGVPELTPIRTQLQLLDRYWRARIVRADGQADAREAVLRAASKQMVETRQLRAERALVGDATNSAALTDLLSSQVLIEWQPSPGGAPERGLLAYPHNVLFDYACSRLILPQTPDQLVQRLSAEPDLVLVIRPSLTMLLQRLWNDDRNRFWEVAFKLVSIPALPEVGKLIAPTVVSGMATDVSDLDPLYEALASAENQRKESAQQILRHIVGALLPGAS